MRSEAGTASPLTRAQSGIWFAQQLAPGNPQFNTAECIELRGEVDREALSAATLETLCEIEILGARFRETADGGAEQTFGHRPDRPTHVDLSSAPDPWAAAQEWMAVTTRTVVDLRTEPAVATAVLALAEDRTVLYIRAHHIVLDAFGFGLLTKRIAQTYTARTTAAPLPAARFGSVAAVVAEEERYRESHDFAADRDFWLTYLRDAPEAVALAPGRGGIATRSHARRTVLSADTTAAIRSAATASSVMWTDLVTAAVATYLFGTTGRTDVTVAYPVMNRLGTAAVDVPTTAVNVLPLRLRPSAALTGAEFAAQVRASADEFRTHTRYRGEDVARDLRLPGGSRGVMGPSVNVKPFGDVLNFGSIRAAVHSVARGPLQDLMVTVRPLDGAGELEMWVDGDADSYTPDDLAGHADRLVHLIAAVAGAIDAPLGSFDVVTGAELARIVAAPTEHTAPADHTAADDRTVVTLLLAQAARTPDAPAVTDDTGTWTFAEFADAALRIASYLTEHGVTPGGRVALALPRTRTTLAAMFGVLAAGAVHVPVDPGHPARRVTAILTDCSPDLVLCAANADPELRATVQSAAARVGVVEDALAHPDQATAHRVTDSAAGAYVIFTSGSTGRPKGVEVGHRSLVALFDSHRRRVYDRVREQTGRDRLRVGHAWSFAFDASWQPQLWLLDGHCVHLVAEDIVPDTVRLAAQAIEQGWDFVELSPAQLEQVLDLGAVPAAALPALGFGGDAVTPALWDRLRQRNRDEGSSAFNFYGPTECTVDALMADVDATASPCIGRPVDGSAAYVVGPGLRPLPPGFEGELYLSGRGLAQGYLGDPGLTSTRFVADPFRPGRRMYRTGDRARLTGDGDVVHCGRADDQVKVRGFRIDLGEVEAALAAAPGIESAVATVRDDIGVGPRLLGYVTVDPSAVLDDAAVRRSMADRVPAYMIPAAFTRIDRIPLTANGKVDRRALPAPAEQVRQPSRPPATDAEAAVLQEFRTVLGVEDIGVDDDFFVLGGHSLLASRIVARLRAAHGWTGSLRTVFDHPTAAGLAPFVASTTNAAAPATPSITQRPRPDRLPLSYAQQRLWFQFQLGGPSATFNIPVALRLTGRMDPAALRAALGEVIERHATLRTIFPTVDGEPVQQVLEVGSIPLFTEQVSAAAEPDRLRELAGHCFDLTRERPVRAHVLVTAEDRVIVLLLVHHIASDEVSTPIILRDWAAAYERRLRGESRAFAESTRPDYADYAIWQRETLGDADDAGSEMSRQIGFWTRTLGGVREESALRTDRPRPRLASGRGAVVEVAVAAETAAAARSLASRNSASMFMVVHAALAVVLGRSGDGDDVVVGTPTAGRPVEELDALVGFFVNTLALRTDLSGDPTFDDLVRRVRSADLDAFAHQDAPFDQVAAALAPTRHAARHPVFQIFLQYRARPAVAPFAGVAPELAVVDTGASQFDLTFDVVDEGDDGLTIRVEYATDLYDATTAERLAQRLRSTLDHAVRRPDTPLHRLTVASPQDLAVVAETSAGPAPVGAPPTPVTELLHRGRTTPDAMALAAPDGDLTFAELSARAAALTGALRDAGVGPEDVVAIRLPRSTDLVVALVAVWFAGGAYLVVEPSHPRERAEFLLADSDAKVLITRSDDETAWPVPVVDSRAAGRPTAVQPHPDSAAYVVYTSGSTGRPKGVVATHGGLAALLAAQRSRILPAPESGGGRNVLCAYSFAFDSSVEQLVSMVGGHTLHLLGEDRMADSAAIVDLVRRHRIDVVDCVPLLMSALLGDGLLDGAHVPRTLAVGGEAVGPDLWRQLASAQGVDAFNLYGPSECTVDASVAAVTGTRVHLGTPLPGTVFHVFDAHLAAVPLDTPGELYVAGPGLTRGYAGRRDLTAARFVANPDGSGGRLYRTGDIVRRSADGTIEYLGRADGQVKIRGFRVEIGEIESVLGHREDLSACAVDVRDVGRGDGLVGYLVPRDESADVDAIREWLHTRLPDYLVPSVFVTLDALPVTANGKVDRAALPDPRPEPDGPRRAPADDVERALCEVFSRVLGGVDAGPDDDFFALGGDSIVSIQAVSAARAVGIRFTARDVFERRTVAGLAAVATLDSGPSTDADDGTGEVSLSPIMRDLIDRGGSFTRFAQSRLLVAPAGLDHAGLERIWDALLERHPMLRARLADDHSGLSVPPAGSVRAADILTTVTVDATGVAPVLDEWSRFAADSLDPVGGRMLRVVHFDGAGGDRLLVVVHHLVVDGVSWRILVADLARIHAALVAGEDPEALPTGTSFRAWSAGLVASAPQRAGELPHWLAASGADGHGDLRLARRAPTAADTIAAAESVSVAVEPAVAEAVLTTVPDAFDATVTDILVTALVVAVSRHADASGVVRLDVEGHGREESAVPGADLSATVGWFTSLYPTGVDVTGLDLHRAEAGSPALTRAVKIVKDERLRVPDNGIGYGILRHLEPGSAARLAAAPAVEIGFNYLGRLTLGETAGTAWSAAPEAGPLGGSVDSDMPVSHVLEIGAVAEDTPEGIVLRANWGHVPALVPTTTVAGLAAAWVDALGMLAAHAVSGGTGTGGLTPAELTALDLDQDEIDEFELDF